MIDSVVNLLFRCPHKRLTRPVTPVGKDGKPIGETYVVCLDCAKQFSYDFQAMHMGKALPTSASTGVLPPGMPGPHKSKLKLALASVPLGIIIGSMLTSKFRRAGKPSEPAKPPATGPDSDI